MLNIMLAIVNGRVLTATGKSYPHATVLVENGRITAVEEVINIPPNAEILDASGCWVTPGLIDAHTHIGTFLEPETRNGGCDDNEEATDPTTPQLRSLDAFNLNEPSIEAVRRAGFSVCCSLPGSGNVIGGQGFAFKTAPRTTVDEMMIPGTTVMKFALGENPIDAYGSRKLTPATRMGIGGILRQTLFAAKNYSDQLLASETEPNIPRPQPNFKLEALLPVVRGQMTCRVHCHQSNDIATALRIADEFHLRIVIEHATEGVQLADTLSRRGVPCVVGPLVLGPSKRELWQRSLSTPARLAEAGVEIALTQDSASMTSMLPIYVGLCIKHGLDRETALRAVTIHAAHILGIDNRVGTIEVGKDADIAIFDADPFSNYTSCLYTIIDGAVFKHD